jgi:hypothetical protein
MKREYCLSLWVIYIPVILTSCKASSQTNFWQQVVAPYNGDVRSMTFTGSGVMLGGTYGGGVWRSTRIEYQLPANAFVIMKVFDIIGKEVKSLVNEQQSAGFYHVDLDGTNMPSGAYFCRIQAGSFAVAKRLLLLR